uniref:BICD family like cargo adaptor 1 n=2 Tax=Ornithorhynchus anatinus TaxID=9258 RepID=A0A6I8N3S9_ORNAN
MELELAKCKVDMMALNGQLLDAIQQKLNLSQQLEAWQDDMHRVIDRQLMAKHQKERSRPAASFSGGLRAPRGPGPRAGPPAEQRGPGPEGRRLFSFFRKI